MFLEEELTLRTLQQGTCPIRRCRCGCRLRGRSHTVSRAGGVASGGLREREQAELQTAGLWPWGSHLARIAGSNLAT